MFENLNFFIVRIIIVCDIVVLVIPVITALQSLGGAFKLL